MKTIRYGIPIFFILLSLFFFVSTFNINTEHISNPDEPLYFPIIVSVGLFIFSVIYLIQEMKNNDENHENYNLLNKRAIKTIIIIIVLSLIYTIIFEKVGFLISTIIYLGALLFYLNGTKKWLLNLSVTILSSFTFWYLFYEVLKVNLP